MAVELDGSQHCEAEAVHYDSKRTAHLNDLGIRVVRFSNIDVNKNFDGVCQQILLCLEQQGCHPSVACGDSSPQGEPRKEHFQCVLF